MAKRMNFYIKREDAREYVRSKGNQSHYIEELIIKDMEGEDLTKDKIIELIKEYSSSVDNYVDMEVKGSIEGLFDL